MLEIKTPFLSDYCETLENPPNGYVTYDRDAIDPEYGTNTKATYSCNRGYRLKDGPNSRDCTNRGLWSGTASVCIRVSDKYFKFSFHLIMFCPYS